MKPIRLLAALVVLATGLFAGCSSGPTTAQGPPAAEESTPEVSVRVMQYRSDEVNRVLAVKVGNLADDPVTIDSVEVLAPGFDGVGPVDFAATFPPGRSFDLRVPYGEPVCGEPADGPLAVRLGITGRGTVELRPTEGDALLRRIHDDTCSVSAALEALPLHWKKDGWRPDDTPAGPVVVGTLVAGPVEGPDTMRVVTLEDTTLLTTSTRSLPGGLAPGRTVSVPVVFTAQRCDPHAMADNKKGFEIGVRVARAGAAGGDGVVVPVVPDLPAQDLLEKMVLERCGLADPSR